MPRIISNDPVKNTEIIIFNHFYTHHGEKYTVEELRMELQRYMLLFDLDVLTDRLNKMVDDGLLEYTAGMYKGVSVR